MSIEHHKSELKKNQIFVMDFFNVRGGAREELYKFSNQFIFISTTTQTQ